jgi:hypothetical protein
MTALLLALLVGQPDTLLVSVELMQSQERILVEAVLEADSTLRLPAGPVGQLLGTSFPTPWVTPQQLREAYPTTRVVWLPLELRVVILDDLRVLPASRKAHQQLVARSQLAFGVPVRSGPFAALAFDESLHGLLDLGYSFRGRVSLAGRVDDGGTAMWGVTLAPSSHLFLSYQDGVYRPPNLNGRLAAGPLWLSAAYTPNSPVEVAGLVRFGAVQVFASRQYGVLTFTPSPQWTVQLAQHWETQRTGARISVGPSYASPFSFPVTSISPGGRR